MGWRTEGGLNGGKNLESVLKRWVGARWVKRGGESFPAVGSNNYLEKIF